MKAKESIKRQEEELVETIVGLLEDFHDHAQEIEEARQILAKANKNSRKFHMALATIEVWLGGLEVLVPGILKELEELETVLDGE